MNNLPKNVVYYKSTPEFTNDTIPKGFLGAHRAKAGTWGKIIVKKGTLRYRILEPEAEVIDLTIEKFGVVEPTILHKIELTGDVCFLVEFYR